MNHLLRSLSIALVICIALISRQTFAGGIDVPQQGARGSGQGEAFAAQADDASAIYANPAGLTQIHGTEISGGGTLYFPTWDHQGTRGDEESMHLMSLLPHDYFASDFGLQSFRFGLGITNNFGLNEDWGSNGPLATLIRQGHLYNINIAPTVAYQINDSLSVGAAMNIYWGQLELYRAAVLGAPPTPLGGFHFRGQDWALGATPGVMWKINSQNTVAAVYRSGYQMKYGGEARVGLGGRAVAGPSRAWAAEDFPQSATFAYAFRPIDPLKLETDIVWTDWHTLKNVYLTSNNPLFNQNIPDNWKSTLEFRFGAQYDLTKQWTLRAGYAFGQNAIPSNTYSPLVPDADYNLFSAGIGYTMGNITIDAAYQFIYRERRHISNSIYGSQVNGVWNNNFNELMLTMSLKL